MALETPVWLQAGVYPARLDRRALDELFRQQNRVMRGIVATQRAAGANFTVDVSAGAMVVRVTSQPNGGAFLLFSTAVENVAAGTSPGSGTRTDTLIATVNDPNAGGAAGNNWVLRIIQGTTIPDNSIAIARIARTNTESAILNAAITDVAPRGEWSWTVSQNPPSGKGIPGDLWVQC
jgi:hypothetical protein